MTRSLPESPSLEQLKKQAKSLLTAHKNADQSVIDTIRLLPRFQKASPSDIADSTLTLSEAQQAIALSYGYKNWAVLKSLASHALREPENAEVSYFGDYCWQKTTEAPTGQPVGLSPIDPKEHNDSYFKFIQLPTGQRVEQCDARGRFVFIIYDPADSQPGTRRIEYHEDGRVVGIVRVDEYGAVRTREEYTYLSEPNDPYPLVKAEIYTADGRLLVTHTPTQVSPNAQDIHVTDILGKLVVIIHHEELDKGVPVKGTEEWPSNFTIQS